MKKLLSVILALALCTVCFCASAEGDEWTCPGCGASCTTDFCLKCGTQRPEAVVCLGQATGRKAITPERAALNLMDAARPDNAGNRPAEEPVVPGGPAAYFSTLPVKAMAAAVREAGIPAAVSNTAGTFVCNSLMYAMLHYAASRRPDLPCGFIHVPGPEDGLSREELTRGVAAALAAVAESIQA